MREKSLYICIYFMPFGTAFGIGLQRHGPDKEVPKRPLEVHPQTGSTISIRLVCVGLVCAKSVPAVKVKITVGLTSSARLYTWVF